MALWIYSCAHSQTCSHGNDRWQQHCVGAPSQVLEVTVAHHWGALNVTDCVLQLDWYNKGQEFNMTLVLVVVGSRWHAGRPGAGEGAESSISRPASSRKRKPHWVWLGLNIWDLGARFRSDTPPNNVTPCGPNTQTLASLGPFLF